MHDSAMAVCMRTGRILTKCTMLHDRPSMHARETFPGQNARACAGRARRAEEQA